MDTSTALAPVTDTVADNPRPTRCQMCEHPADSHDALSRRYCAATAAGALTRGCICR